ncbi:conserved hypothetical protein [Verticillium alfalfae VaMs.102]|uniref:Cell wall proline rich protein n=1 Tax=Verticillium alfalfae (strain VaMs.102 / ATCC MYA-4576 / FGSC 10136) TaxID=526221 RepID=C9SHY9_VERA1|nr:conserved hypothetical protein [Verticillium alfalfae VaMs.102]EEY18562.1 conserved hypothetical protein [Verticillium alfalfae VaMs.102]
MATAFGPERAIDATVTTLNSFEFDQTASQRLPSMLPMEDLTHSQSALDEDQTSPRNMPPPNPPFIFPARPGSSSAPSSYSRASGRRPQSAIESPSRSAFNDNSPQSADRPRRSPALPDFSFNPGASMAADNNVSLLSPPMSPLSPRQIPSPSKPGGHGHRRGGSEFVGGNIRSGGSIAVMSTSPTKSESGFASPAFQPPQLGEPPAGGRRRGHAHRRSAAISSHDLTLILQPPKPANALRGSSAPNSPADFGRRPGESPEMSPVQLPVPATPTAEPSTSGTPVESELAAPELPVQTTPRASRPVPRARVGFSDTLEFIPRPLSLVSSDASSTATARPGGHSVSGSISSIISMNDEPVLEKEPAIVAPVEPRRTRSLPPQESRPSTAGAILERSQSIQSVNHSGSSPRRRNSIPTLTHVPDPAINIPSQPSPTKTPKRWSFFGLDPFAGAHSPTRLVPVSPREQEHVPATADASPNSSDQVLNVAPETDGPLPTASKKPSKKSKKKKKKVKAWAGSILKPKSKPRDKKGETDCLPDQLSTHSEPELEYRKDESAVETVASPVTPTVTITDSSSPNQTAHPWKPRSVSTPEDDAAFSMIDLDAALGPFNTPVPHSAEWDAAQKAAGSAKRQLHSAQGMKGFSGPGMHYHRRAESAPEMVPFEASRFGINRFGSSSTMADVFEEDEEEDDDDDSEDGKTTSSLPTSKDSLKDNRSDAAETCSDDDTPPAIIVQKNPLMDALAVQDEEFGRTRHAASMKSERSMNSLHEQVIVEEPRNVDFRSAAVLQETSDSTGSATPSPRHALGHTDLAPVEVSPLHLATPSNIPISPYSMSHGSSFPSPRSPMSYDAQRISTAPSSVNEENTFQSLLLGEPGPELRCSVDIPPSLTSSTSTMTRDSTFVPMPQPRAQMPFRPDQRPVSVSSAAFGRRRSSLASLSRLISSSHGERSKLSEEVPVDSEAEKKQKVSRAKRLSRMVQFWKAKDESET